MGILKEAIVALRGRRLVEWLALERPQIPVIFGVSFYIALYFQFKYDWISRVRGRPAFDNYAYVKKAAELERARLPSQSSSPISDLTSSTAPHSSTSDSLAATGIN